MRPPLRQTGADTETTTEAGDTIPSDALGSDETWTCEVTPSDSEGDGTSDSSLLVINMSELLKPGAGLLGRQPGDLSPA